MTAQQHNACDASTRTMVVPLSLLHLLLFLPQIEQQPNGVRNGAYNHRYPLPQNGSMSGALMQLSLRVQAATQRHGTDMAGCLPCLLVLACDTYAAAMSTGHT